MIIKLRQYWTIYLLILSAFILIVITIVSSVLWDESVFNAMQIIAGLFSGLIALIIPFQINKIKKQEEKMEKRQILERIIRIIKIFVRHDKKTNENQSSIFSGIDYIKLNNELLHHINISLRANSTKGRTAGNIYPHEIYDLIINDKLTIRITIIATLKGENFYQIKKIEFYDFNERKIITDHEEVLSILDKIPFEKLLNKV